MQLRRYLGGHGRRALTFWFENLIALHLLKLCHFLHDREGFAAELHYLRDRTGREVDFLVTVDPEQCSSTAKHAKHAKELPAFAALALKSSEVRSGRYRSGGFSDLVRLGDSLRSLRSLR